ncbi:MAG: hypothetical protein Phyf2KO_07680 [Phycisphaerales bacterium]
MSQRTDRISALLRESIQKVISKGLQDPRVRGLITVTRVTTADDLTQSTVFISVLPADRAELSMHGLKAAAAHIRHEVGNDVAIRKMPKLVFKLDAAASKQAGVLDAIAKATREREESESGDANNARTDSEPSGSDTSEVEYSEDTDGR